MGSNMTASDDLAQEKPAWSDKDLANNPHQNRDKAGRVEDMFTSIASSYDVNNRIHSMWRDQAWRKKAVKLSKVTPSESVVDVACGTGDLSKAFYSAGFRDVLGVDFTQAMLDVAIEKAKKANMEISYQQGDAMNLQLEDGCADVVSIAFGIRNVQKPELAFAEFYRILRPGGRLVILEFSQPKNPLLSFLNTFYTNKIMPLTATFISQDRSGAYKYLPKSVETFLNPAELSDQVQASGFSSVSQYSQTFGVCTITVAHKS